jgi:hypothetical protein
MPDRSFLQSQVTTLVERPPSWKVGKQGKPIDKPMSKKTLEDWLHKASFWAQVHPSIGLLYFNFSLLRLFHS